MSPTHTDTMKEHLGEAGAQGQAECGEGFEVHIRRP